MVNFADLRRSELERQPCRCWVRPNAGRANGFTGRRASLTLSPLTSQDTAMAADHSLTSTTPAIAAALRDMGHDVIGVAEHSDMRAMTDEEVLARAASQGRWLLSEKCQKPPPAPAAPAAG